MKEKASTEGSKKFTQVIARLIDSSNKTQKQIAEEMGLNKPNIITMFKQGQTAVPPERVPALARALHADAKYLLRLNLQERFPELLEVIDDVMGPVVTEHERVIINALRKHTHNSDPALLTSKQMQALEAFAETLMQ